MYGFIQQKFRNKVQVAYKSGIYNDYNVFFKKQRVIKVSLFHEVNLC